MSNLAFLEKIRKNFVYLSSAELAQSVVKVKQVQTVAAYC